MKPKYLKLILYFLCFTFPFTVSWITKSDTLGFADAAEFALVSHIRSVAHAPGFPAYVLTAWVWDNILSIFISDHVLVMTLFSMVSTALSTVLLYRIFVTLLDQLNDSQQQWKREVVSALSAISFTTGVTIWFWSNAVEVYAFHLFAMALLLYGLVRYNINREYHPLFIGAIGLGLGLANHHLTMIFFTPFILFFFFKDDLFRPGNIADSITKKLQFKLKRKHFLVFTASSGGITLLFYGWMYFRASDYLVFEFGNPDSLERMFYHLSGGYWLETAKKKVEGLVSLRFPFFMDLIIRQYLLFIPLVILGVIFMIRKKIILPLVITAGYFGIVLVYQLRIEQSADTDAYMVLPFMAGTVFTLYGMYYLSTLWKPVVFIAVILIGVQVVVNFPRTDKRDYNVGSSLMMELDRSSPRNSIVLIADWTLVIQYYYHRIVHNFRPDLVVLNYDLKFTNYMILPTLYPEFYKQVQAEYDEFVRKLAIAHPQEVYNTGCTLNTQELMGAYASVINKMLAIAKAESRPLLIDPKAFYFMLEQKVLDANFYVSGCFVSKIKTDVSQEFVDLDYEWLDSEILLYDPAASHKMIDLEAMIDFHKNYAKTYNKTEYYNRAAASWAKIKRLQKKMNKNMPFVLK